MKLGKFIKRLLKIFLICTAVAVAYCVMHVVLVLNPDVLFAHERKYKNFTVHMREEIAPEITGVLDRVETLLSVSELNDDSVQHHIYIINSYGLSRYFMLRNVHFGCNLPNGHTMVTMAEVTEDIARCETKGPDDRRIRTLSETITHEIAHALIRNHVGWLGDQRIPSWVKEGYCETIAEGSAIDRRMGLDLLKRPWSAYTPGIFNFKHRLMVEYLLDVKSATIAELVSQPPDYQEVAAEVFGELRADEAAFLARIGFEQVADD